MGSDAVRLQMHILLQLQLLPLSLPLLLSTARQQPNPDEGNSSAAMNPAASAEHPLLPAMSAAADA